jgi:glyoxylase-like metal-dependent hydrolase (beta-lactamase superfamily II)
MMQITSDIFQVGGSGYTSDEDAAVYLLDFGGHAALVDAGCGFSRERLLRNIRACGVAPEQIEYLLITHCHFDHTGGVKDLRDMIPFQIVAHELEATYLETGDNTVTAAKWYGGASLQAFQVDRKLTQPREIVELGGRRIEAIHIPGHSPGSVAYMTRSDGLKVLFGQDVHGPLSPLILSNTDDYYNSLKLLIGLKADILCEGHFGVYRGKDKVREYIESYL